MTSPKNKLKKQTNKKRERERKERGEKRDKEKEDRSPGKSNTERVGRKKKRSPSGNEERQAFNRVQATSFLLKMGKMSRAKPGNRSLSPHSFNFL